MLLLLLLLCRRHNDDLTQLRANSSRQDVRIASRAPYMLLIILKWPSNSGPRKEAALRYGNVGGWRAVTVAGC